MKYLVMAREMKRADEYTSAHFGMESLVLMERAALSAFRVIAQEYPDAERFVVCCGYGNNGGDGLALARLLFLAGKTVTVCMAGEYHPDKISASCGRQLETASAYEIPILYYKEETQLQEVLCGADCVVDALFGVGISRDITGLCADIVACINNRPKHTVCVSLDMPSGIHTDTGEVSGIAVAADMTVTFAFLKLGLVLYPGCSFAGRIVLGDAGITEKSFGQEPPRHFTFGREELAGLLPYRDPAGNKGTFGKVLVVAGCEGMAGAALLCARAAYRAGAGMVKVVTCEANRVIVQSSLPEALLCIYDPENMEAQAFQEELARSIAWADSLVTGPGLGTSPEAACLMAEVLRLLQRGSDHGETALVADADALNLLAKDERLQELFQGCACPKIITPHPMELARLLGTTNHCTLKLTRPDLEENPLTDLRRRFPDTVFVCKDARTFVFPSVESGDRRVFVNTLGNDGMATAGSGDVLSGILGALTGQRHKDAFSAACLGVALHGAAGDLAARQGGRRGMTAGDLAESVRDVCRLEEG